MAATRSGGPPLTASRLLDGNWYCVPKAVAKVPDIQRELTVKIEDHFGNEILIPLFEIYSDCIRVPRLYGLSRYGPPRYSNMKEGAPIDPAHLRNVHYTLTGEQAKCIEALRTRYFTPAQVKAGAAGCVLNLACGKGKTYIGIQRLVDGGRRTLVVCHSNVSVGQWVKNFRHALPDVTVSEYHGEDNFPETDVVIATIHPLVLDTSIGKRKPVEFGRWLQAFGQVIYDEIHIFGAPKFSTIFNVVHPRLQLGLSATPERSDGMERNFELKIGPVLDAQHDLGIAPPTFQVTVYPLVPPVSGMVVPSAEMRNGAYATTVKAFTLSDARAEYLVKTLRSHLSRIPNENILVFCNYVEEVDFVHRHLSAAFPTFYIDRVCGDICAESIAAMADAARILVCTYKKGGTAFSPIRFRAVVIWSPTRAMVTQAVGRIQRWRDEEGITLGPEGSWNVLPRTIYDFIDQHTVAASQYYSGSSENGNVIASRRATYKRCGYRIFKPAESRSTVAMVEEVSATLAALGYS